MALPHLVMGVTDERLIDAGLRCIERWGVAKTTFDDVAREAGVSRATVYRAFPGGKDALVEVVATTERTRLFGAVAAAVDAAETVEDVLVAGLHVAGRRLAEHVALSYLFTYEPEIVLPMLAFDRMDELLAAAVVFARPTLTRFLDEEDAARTAELCARIVVTYTSWPCPDVDLSDQSSVRRLVRQLLLPALQPV